jgi:hypothetical protein
VIVVPAHAHQFVSCRLFVAALGKGRDGILLLLFLMSILTVFFSTLMYTVEVADCVEINGKWVCKVGCRCCEILGQGIGSSWEAQACRSANERRIGANVFTDTRCTRTGSRRVK